MRFGRIHARHFGPHHDREFELDSKIVLIFGRNESGKSSFRSAIETLLYGFEPATRESHPLAIWGEGRGGDLHLEADCALDDGSPLGVERVLQSTGKSRTTVGGSEFAGARKGNNPLPLTDGLPRALYRSIYAIETEQLAALEASEQSHIDELLLPETQSLGLRPSGDVRDALRAEIGSLFRPQKRGQQRVRELEDALTAALKRVRAADEEEDALRNALREQGELSAQRAADKRAKDRLERIQNDAPYLRELFELRQRERAHGDPVDLSDLGDAFSLSDPEEIERLAEEIEQGLRDPIARVERDALVLSEAHEQVLNASAEIHAAEVAVRTHDDDRRAAANADAAAKRLLSEATRDFSDVLAQPSDEALFAALERLPLAQLESLQERWALDWEAHATKPEPIPPRPPLWTLLLTALAGAAAIAASLPALPVWAPPIPPWLAPSAIALTILAAFAAFFLRARPQPKGDPPTRPNAIDELLTTFPVADAMHDSPTGLRRWIEAAAKARRGLAEATNAAAESQRLEQATVAERAGWIAVCERLGLATAGDGPVLVERLCDALEHAKVEQQRVLDDTAQRRNARTLIDARQPSLDRHRAHLTALGLALRRNLPEVPDPHAAYTLLEERRREQDYVRSRRAELERDPRWTGFCDDPRVTADRAPDDAPWNEAVAQARTDAIGELDAAIESASVRLGELGEILGSDPGSRSARARDEAAAIRETLANAKTERDRLALLDTILARAEQNFREAHQPDVLRRASEYLERVTRGRYSRLDYLEGADPGLYVACRERSEPVKVAEPISRGTLDQIFLCLRLGLLDHLDQDRERLPLVLDDALLRMDDVRRPEVYALLADVTRTRQVFFLTCHRAIADEAEKQLATTRIELGQE